jgi:hypothetical protein
MPKKPLPLPPSAPSPFKFGFFAGLGFLFAQVVFGLIVGLIVVLIGYGTIFSLGHRFSATPPLPAQAVAPATSR